MKNELPIRDHSNKVCIVGGGPGGLCMARALKHAGLAYDQIERHTDFGGIWDLDNPGTPMYESAHFISSRDLSGFIDYPMPKDFPDYPSNRQILQYLRAFAQSFGLYEHVQFGISVVDIQQEESDTWLVSLSDGEIRRYRAVVCATGCNWDPNMPEISGQFDGEIRHAVSYRSGDEFEGKRVLIVGAGNSGADIACDAARRASKAMISMRRGYHFIPKHIFGLPVDEFSERGPQLPLFLSRLVFKPLLRLLQGDLGKLGLPKPDHNLFESHPLLNSQLIHHLQHGDIQVKPDVSHYEGPHVVFKDGQREEVDLVIYATGYQWSCPYAQSYLTWSQGRPKMYLSMFNKQYKNLFGIGYLETNSSAYKLFDNQAHLIVSYLLDQHHRPDKAKQFERFMKFDEPDLSGGIRFVQSPRHEVYLEVHALKKKFKSLRKQMGWPSLEKGFFEPQKNTPSTQQPAQLA